MRTSENLRVEIEERFGFFPPFFEPAMALPHVLENLWRQTLSAYIENPLSALFKEKLNALLSRFCLAPYCIMVHSAALRPLGMTAREVLALLDAPVLEGAERELSLGILPIPSPEDAAAPPPNSALEETLLSCATTVFLDQPSSDICRAELQRLLGRDLYLHLIAYLAYIKTCHTWIEAHPNIAFESDLRVMANLDSLLEEEPVLAEFFQTYKERIAGLREMRATEAVVAAAQAQAGAQLQSAHEHTAEILESITDAFYAVDSDFCFTYLNGKTETLWGPPRERFIGKRYLDMLPQVEGSIAWERHQRAMRERVADHFEAVSVITGLWVEVNIYPTADGGLAVYFRDIGARKALEEERERLLTEVRARAERETVLNRINAAIRATTDPDTVHARAAALLGEALGADRCYLAVYDPHRDAVRIARDWHRSDLTSVAGEYRLTDYQAYVDALYANGTAAIADSTDPSVKPVVRQVLASFGIRAFLGVPMFDNGVFIAAVTASMNDGPRQWTPENVALMEAVLTQTRLAMESARVRQREINIASHLQTALQPDLPGTVPGLTLTKHYEAALTHEASVGGDFYDVYAIEKGCTAIVLGDLSGKGLSAAVQVSIVRNMLRAFLYSKPSIAAAVNELNYVLAENNLLTGFSTLFVGTYDGALRTINYVNCGQEPALVRRAATGIVDQLGPTGPILGTLTASRFVEKTAVLAPGDALAIFSDGLTEVGPSRRDMLGIEGVTELLSHPIPNETELTAQEIADALRLRMIAGVDAAAKGGVMRDDVCLLVAVVE